MQFAGTVLTEGQQMIFKFTEKSKSENPDKPGKEIQLKIVVKSLEGAIIGQKTSQVICNFWKDNFSILGYKWPIESKRIDYFRQVRRIRDQLHWLFQRVNICLVRKINFNI